MLKKEQFHKDILDGLTLFYKSSFIKDIRNTALKYPFSSLGNALNRKQTSSKLWLLDTLFNSYGPNLGTIHILGGWYGVLGSFFLHDPRFNITHITSFDLDAKCAPIANSLNATSVTSGLFEAITADMFEIVYGDGSSKTNSLVKKAPTILINTSCEHLTNFGKWFSLLPKDVLLILQSNNYFSEPAHINSVHNLVEFKKQAPLTSILFEGELKLEKYTRFMLIGHK